MAENTLLSIQWSALSYESLLVPEMEGHKAEG